MRICHQDAVSAPRLGRRSAAPRISTDKPDTVIAEWSVKGHVIPTGNTYNMAYATFVTVRDGQITGYREYWNPLAFGQALEGVSFG
ncbi:ketosteroid isomerase-like protein [Catenulispora sp. MAP5-51]|uniref:nuclear transport factor 2 family protein n=1 Tax=Catenulispora sp. MAP5-51 TaxID=3156298 RepID=UPI003512C54B